MKVFLLSLVLFAVHFLNAQDSAVVRGRIETWKKHRPVYDAHVSFWELNPKYGYPSSYAAHTDTTGNYFLKIKSGKYRVRVSANEKNLQGIEDTVTVKTNDTIVMDFVLPRRKTRNPFINPMVVAVAYQGRRGMLEIGGGAMAEDEYKLSYKMFGVYAGLEFNPNVAKPLYGGKVSVNYAAGVFAWGATGGLSYIYYADKESSRSYLSINAGLNLVWFSNFIFSYNIRLGKPNSVTDRVNTFSAGFRIYLYRSIFNAPPEFKKRSAIR